MQRIPVLNQGRELTVYSPPGFGHRVPHIGERLYLFLSSCRYNDLDTALKFIFRLPPDEIFTNRLVWFEDLQILSEVRQMAGTTPGAWRDAPAVQAPPSAAEPQAAPLRLVPEEVTLNTPVDKGDAP